MNDDLEDDLEAYTEEEDYRKVYGPDFSKIMKEQIDRAIIANHVTKAKDPTKKFWMLFVEGQSSPTHKHEDYMTATLEAKRIMDQPNFKGARVYILEAKGLVEAKVTKEFTHTEIKYE